MLRRFLLGFCLVPGIWAQSGYWPGAEWRRSSPSEQGLSQSAIDDLTRRIRNGSIRDLDSLLIVRNGYLVVEEYFAGWQAGSAHTLQSDTKSVLALLTGIAIDQGSIPGPGAPALGYFPQYAPVRNLDDRKAGLRIDDLLTMRTGLDWSEATSPNPLTELNQCRCDWLRFVLDWPTRETPGTRWEYNSGGVILLGGLIQAATGVPLATFAQERLFEPLGIQGAWWYTGLPDNLPHGGGGLNLRSQDMARIGYLVLRNGRWNDRQLVSREWLTTMLTRTSRNVRTFANRWVDYGYLWWLYSVDGGEGPASDVYTCAGAQDQWIFVVPKYDLVVAVTGHTSVTFGEPVGFFFTNILPAVTDRPVATVSAATFLGPIAPDSIATAFGQALDGPVVVRDSFGVERPAQILYRDAGQVNFVVPAGTATGLATVTVGSGSVGTVAVEAVAPGLFAAVYHHGVIALYGTGIRGGASVTPSIGRVEYAGAQCCFPGLDQVNLVVPSDVSGDLRIRLNVDGRASNEVTVPIRAPTP